MNMARTSACVRAHYPTLLYLRKATKQQRAAVVRSANKSFFNAICECSRNVLNGNIKLTASQKRSLARYKAALRGVANKKKSLKYKRRVVQKGGFLSTLLSAVVPVLGSLLGGVLNR